MGTTKTLLQDRIALKKAIRSYKKSLKGLFEGLVAVPFVDSQMAEKVIMGLRELVNLQKRLNATYVEGDEKTILQRSQKRRERST
jgi:hypothetical protein